MTFEHALLVRPSINVILSKLSGPAIAAGLEERCDAFDLARVRWGLGRPEADVVEDLCNRDSG